MSYYVVLALLSDHKLPLKHLIVKGFDGAVNMSGKDGVQQLLFAAGVRIFGLLSLFCTSIEPHARAQCRK